MKFRTLFVRFMERVETVIRFELINETETNAPSFEAAYTKVVGNHTKVPTHVLFQDVSDKSSIAGFGLKEKTVIDMNKWQIKVVTTKAAPSTRYTDLGDKKAGLPGIADRIANQRAQALKGDGLIWCQFGSCAELVDPDVIKYCDEHSNVCPIHKTEFVNIGDGFMMACLECYGDTATEVPPGDDDDTPPTKPSGKRQCLGTTKKGLPCNGGAMIGTDYCGPHTEKATVYNSEVETNTEYVMLTGHGKLEDGEDPDTIEESLVCFLTQLKEDRTADICGISGGCAGGDYLMARACVRAEVPFKLVLPNRHYWDKYQTPGQDFMRDNATEILYTVKRPDVQDWKARWGAERWYMDNFARNKHMVQLSNHYIAISRNDPNEVLAVRNWKAEGYIRGGTADGIRQIADHGKARDGKVDMYWVTPSDGSVKLVRV